MGTEATCRYGPSMIIDASRRVRGSQVPKSGHCHARLREALRSCACMGYQNPLQDQNICYLTVMDLPQKHVIKVVAQACITVPSPHGDCCSGSFLAGPMLCIRTCLVGLVPFSLECHWEGMNSVTIPPCGFSPSRFGSNPIVCTIPAATFRGRRWLRCMMTYASFAMDSAHARSLRTANSGCIWGGTACASETDFCSHTRYICFCGVSTNQAICVGAQLKSTNMTHA